jgi:DNA-binding response OmpR family regulator
MAGKILVIDDEKTIGELIQIAMQAKGYKVEYSTTGEGGVRLFSEFRPDIVLVDMTLPDLDGVEVARRIKQTEAGKKTPLLMMTGRSISDKDLDRGLFVSAIEKPISMAKLATFIEGQLKAQKH